MKRLHRLIAVILRSSPSMLFKALFLSSQILFLFLFLFLTLFPPSTFNNFIDCYLNSQLCIKKCKSESKTSRPPEDAPPYPVLQLLPSPLFPPSHHHSFPHPITVTFNPSNPNPALHLPSDLPLTLEVTYNSIDRCLSVRQHN